jgi:hypothetical protein
MGKNIIFPSVSKVASEIRWCSDIGMFCIDRPRTTCKHATSFCAKTCFNIKIEKYYNLSNKDIRNEIYWQQITGEQVAKTLDRKRNQTSRFRLMSRGEAISTTEDIPRIKSILEHNSNRLVWLPTRAWRKLSLREMIEHEIRPFSNVRLFASLDPSNTEHEKQDLINNNWSTMFYGDNDDIRGRYLCPKTWNKQKGHCAICKHGCFFDQRIDIHLKQH